MIKNFNSVYLKADENFRSTLCTTFPDQFNSTPTTASFIDMGQAEAEPPAKRVK
jgi:hypothetical protein